MENLTLEQRAHEIALQITSMIYQRKNLPLSSETDYHEFTCYYRDIIKQVRATLIDGQSDLQ